MLRTSVLYNVVGLTSIICLSATPLLERNSCHLKYVSQRNLTSCHRVGQETIR
uniref:Uncharacterized protein n=1 Tax=Populus trichocarpa TaxID=3694 RepID=A0A3N7FLD6_POPTR